MEIPKIIGHRGAAAHAPENTLAGFRTAAALGVTFVEFDVRLTADKRLVLIHDAELNRTTNASGLVRNASLEDIQKLDAGSWFAKKFAGERPPSLEEAIVLLTELGLGANIEMKADKGLERETGRVAAAVVARHWPKSRPAPLFSSFQTGCVEAVQAAAPDIPRAYLMGRPDRDWQAKITRLGCATVNVGQRGLTRKTVDALLTADLPLLVYTVNDRARAKQLFDWGVAALFTDDPPALMGL